MPKIKIDRSDNCAIRCNDNSFRSGLRERQSVSEEKPAPMTQKEKDECFDMYRSVDTRRSSNTRKKTKRELPQLWFVASIIAALGTFCIFMDSVFATAYGVTLKMASFEILLSPSDAGDAMPSCALYMSAVPFVFLIMFGVFAYLKEEAFERTSIAMITVSVFIIAVLIFWSKQITGYGGSYMYSLSPGYAVLAEIGCAVALIIVIACQRILGHVSQNRASFCRR